MADYIKFHNANCEYVVLSRKEALDIIVSLTAQLADEAAIGQMAGAVPETLFPCGRKLYITVKVGKEE